LKGWNWNIGGHCYNPHKISLPTASHPYVDNIYIGMTCFYVFGSLTWASRLVNLYLPILLTIYGVKQHRVRLFNKVGGRAAEAVVLMVAALQLPLHLYSLLALRASNEKLLNSGTTEQEWGFGQVVAVMLLGSNVLGLLNGVQGMFVCFAMSPRCITINKAVKLTHPTDYREWKKLVAEHRAEERSGAAAQKLTTGQAQGV
jgi:heme/copper-type cytochrome/quinol oxidase subunit 4